MEGALEDIKNIAVADTENIIEEIKRIAAINKVSQIEISKRTGVHPSQVSQNLKNAKDSRMYLHNACAYARAIGAKVIVVSAENEIKDEKRLDYNDLRAALTSEQRNAEFLREQIKLLRSDLERLRNK